MRVARHVSLEGGALAGRVRDLVAKESSLFALGTETTNDDGLEEVLKDFAGVAEVNLDECSLTDGVLLCLRNSFDWRCLRVLSLANNSLTEDGCRLLAQPLKRCIALQELLVGGNRLRDGGVRVLCALLEDNCLGLTSLDVSDCGLSAEVIPAINSLLEKSPCLFKLNLSENSIGAGGASLLIKGEQNRTNHLCDFEKENKESCFRLLLRILMCQRTNCAAPLPRWLSARPLQATAALLLQKVQKMKKQKLCCFLKKLNTVVAHHRTLLTLDLSNNMITKHGIDKLSKALSRSRRLIHLYLSRFDQVHLFDVKHASSSLTAVTRSRADELPPALQKKLTANQNLAASFCDAVKDSQVECYFVCFRLLKTKTKTKV
jgi:Ran GTPase-activating protein (RanGAP) involved in mRNA processing and transport